MPPNNQESLKDKNEMDNLAKLQPSNKNRKYKVVYRNVIVFGYVHAAAIYGLYLCFVSARWETMFLNWILYIIAAIGVTVGAHRLWSHKTFKAKRPLEILLMLFNCVAVQRTIINWARDHRLHHKHSDTDADPHNATRGLFYSHIGWLLVKKHAETIEKGKLIDTSDLTNNPVLMFQYKYCNILLTSFGFIIPTLIPMLFWEETFVNSWHVTLLRYALSLNSAFAVNSIAHRWGYRPYNAQILPAENVIITALTLGEGFHNYHHVFPTDYRTAELSNKFFNYSTKFIDFMASIGWAYDLKSASDEAVKSKMERLGDGSDVTGKINQSSK